MGDKPKAVALAKDIYNGGMGGIERISRTSAEVKHELEKRKFIPENERAANIYKKIVEILNHEPEGFFFDKEGVIYLSVGETAQLTDLSNIRIRGLAREGRLVSIKPGGHDLFISLDSVISYETEGREPPGRPRSRHGANKP